jgi:hypothetical protein
VVAAYKNLRYVGRDFRHIKADDLDLRPVFHRAGEAREGLCADLHARRLPGLAHAPGMGAAHLHRRGPARADEPVAPARRSEAARAKASHQHDPAGRPYRSFRGLLAHPATLTRNQVRFAGTPAAIPVLTEPTNEQRRAFDLIGVPIPLTLK